VDWERIKSPTDRRLTVYWRFRLSDRSWLAVKRSPIGARWLWVWRAGPRLDQVRKFGTAGTLGTARRYAVAAVNDPALFKGVPA
jgi:hypothetical protein